MTAPLLPDVCVPTSPNVSGATKGIQPGLVFADMEQPGGFVDEVAAGLGAAQIVGVSLDLPLRPGS